MSSIRLRLRADLDMLVASIQERRLAQLRRDHHLVIARLLESRGRSDRYRQHLQQQAMTLRAQITQAAKSERSK